MRKINLAFILSEKYIHTHSHRQNASQIHETAWGEGKRQNKTQGKALSCVQIDVDEERHKCNWRKIKESKRKTHYRG